MTRRIHVTGAAGTGVTTLGRALATRFACPVVDSDDLYWLPTNPPYREKRPVEERLRLFRDLVGVRPDWVLSGSVDSWGDTLPAQFDIVVFLTAPTEVRLARIAAREDIRRGSMRQVPDRDWRRARDELMEWASGYEEGRFPGRSRQRHENWLAGLPCPVLRLDAMSPTDVLVGRVAEVLTP